jgi:hypothetical protein
MGYHRQEGWYYIESRELAYKRTIKLNFENGKRVR